MSIIGCSVCNNTKWLEIPDPAPGRSVTTSGVIIEVPLGKSQCDKCGFVQRTRQEYLGMSDFYERQYATYYERPGVESFNRSRYRDIAEWVFASIGDFAPENIVEIGCGRGWTMQEMRKFFPAVDIEGIEPSIENSEYARRNGFVVHTGKLEKANLPVKKYDLVFSNHVIQHCTDPLDFMESLGAIVSDNGIVVLTVQDASLPSNELLYSDQNFSFMPHHLCGVAEQAGLEVLSWRKAPVKDSLLFSQLLVCAKTGQIDRCGGLEGDPLPQVDHLMLTDLYYRRGKYTEAWGKIGDFLCWQAQRAPVVCNFGAGMYSYLLACYCERYWQQVDFCAVDGGRGDFFGKKVDPLGEIRLSRFDSVVLGVRPALQKHLFDVMTKKIPANIVCWDNFVNG